MTKPTPCEHEWQIQHDEVKSYWQCTKCLLRKTSVEPTPEEKCKQKWCEHITEDEYKNHWLKYEGLDGRLWCRGFKFCPICGAAKPSETLQTMIAKALSAAFEKGREAR